MSCLQIGQPPLVFLLQFFVCVTTLFIFWHDGNRQLASRHWQACTSEWMHRWILCFLASWGFACLRSVGDEPSSRSKPNFSILCGWPTFVLHPMHRSKSCILYGQKAQYQPMRKSEETRRRKEKKYVSKFLTTKNNKWKLRMIGRGNKRKKNDENSCVFSTYFFLSYFFPINFFLENSLIEKWEETENRKKYSK